MREPRRSKASRWRALASAAGLTALCLMAPGLSAAQNETSAGADAAVEARRGPTDPVELSAFLDGLMAAHLEDHDIVGATVAVVRDGQLLFSGGYGFADEEARTPVDPATTLFRIGSISKLFTWTAVMQMVEEGNLDLGESVEQLLERAVCTGSRRGRGRDRSGGVEPLHRDRLCLSGPDRLGTEAHAPTRRGCALRRAGLGSRSTAGAGSVVTGGRRPQAPIHRVLRIPVPPGTRPSRLDDRSRTLCRRYTCGVQTDRATRHVDE